VVQEALKLGQFTDFSFSFGSEDAKDAIKRPQKYQATIKQIDVETMVVNCGISALGAVSD